MKKNANSEGLMSLSMRVKIIPGTFPKYNDENMGRFSNVLLSMTEFEKRCATLS